MDKGYIHVGGKWKEGHQDGNTRRGDGKEKGNEEKQQ